jgi:hypothetical protein
VRLLVASNEVRRHRLISISYISLLPCHRRGHTLLTVNQSESAVLLGIRPVRCASCVPDFISLRQPWRGS